MTESTPTSGRMVRLPINDVKPYWRNPRVITTEAVDAVSQSIKEFGYSQPIVVDAENVIIIGHTRYTAMRRLDVTEVDVMVADYLSQAQVKQLRVLDNRVSEYTEWDFDALVAEIDTLDSKLLAELFPEAENWGESESDTAERIERAAGLAEAEAWEDVDMEVDFVCPSCYHQWVQEVTVEEIKDGALHPAASKESAL